MAVTGPIPDYCLCPHCEVKFPSAGIESKETSPPSSSEREIKRSSPLENTSNPVPTASRKAPAYFPPIEELPSGESDEGSAVSNTAPLSKHKVKASPRALLVGASALLLLFGGWFAASFETAESVTESDALSGAAAQSAKVDSQGTQADSKNVQCTERRAFIARTGKYPGAKLRADPGFDYPQTAIVTRGAYVSVCKTAETPGKKIPNVWYQISEGKHQGLWIHGSIVDLM